MNEITETKDRQLGLAGQIVFFAILGLFWCVGWLGTHIVPGSIRIYDDFQLPLPTLAVFLFPLWTNCWQIFVVCWIVSLVMGIFLRKNLWAMLAACAVAFIPVMVLILSSSLWMNLLQNIHTLPS